MYLKAANVPIVDDHLEAWISANENNQITELVPELKSDRIPVLIHAAAAHPDKLYPLENWSKIINKLHSRYNILPFFTGAKEDWQIYDELQKLSGVTGVNLAGKLSLRQSLALYKKMRLSICTDSGPAHLSTAVDTPTIVLFGPTDSVRWGPWGKAHKAIFDDSLACRPCHYNKTCDDRPCLTKLDPEIIIQEAIKVLSAENVTV